MIICTMRKKFLITNHVKLSKCMVCAVIRNISQSSLKPKPSAAAPPILSEKNLTILPSIRPDSLQIGPILDVNGKNLIKTEWLETRINLNDIHLHYLKLSKSRLTSLVVMTTLAGYTMAPAPFDIATMVLCCTGTGLVSAAANSINQYHEVPFDSQMSRTKNRVLVKGILSPLHALMFATVSGSLGLVTLYYGVNPVAAALGAANLVLYTSIYTPMKRISIANTWIGSIGLCRRTALRYTIGITGLCSLAPLCNLTNVYFSITVAPLNLYFTYLAWKFYQESDSKTSRKLFRFSLIHLPALMLLLLINKHDLWTTQQKEKENQST
ncbi:protoheme IX farnesyltransferase, mitochondrial isoform X2 [Daktulosphaira vitifoliae]|uniref:protoheme IX farnesyltransferase, mitochondrial isoform X2 n=1 Tax=Daktulosphaira vitifoliae TaxID=58002 RepID=UPI0021AAEC12|nr:protoheme IX farnesyltransferase, mitochondrial isoform X2 [Daktulosphaira vitifoliae]